MRPSRPTRTRSALWFAHCALGLALAACGGSTGNERDSGPNKTTLRVEAADDDGDSLQYQWRVTAGAVENRNARETVWTLPDGPGLHFAYVRVADGRGGWTELQYAVASDALGTPVPERAPRTHTPPAVTEVDGALMRLRVKLAANPLFADPAGGAAQRRMVYLPDVRVQVVDDGGTVVYAGSTDLAGEISLPRLDATKTHTVRCATADEGPLATCGTLPPASVATRADVSPVLGSERNLRLHGHVALADGSLCGAQDAFFSLQSAATVTVQAADGTPLSKTVRVNRFGDYALDAAVPAGGALKLAVRCEGYQALLDVPAATGGYAATQPVELSHAVPNRRPRIVKMVANGPDGNVRGRMVVPEANAASNGAPGADHFLTYKGKDTKLSSCLYYRALGAAKDCDAQGNMVEPISFDDWLRRNRLSPYVNGNTEVAADYINKMDLNLVRRMTATRLSADHLAFSVCNSPGPDGQTQREVDEVMELAFAGERRVACVTMEWSTTPGVNGNRPFTKFFTFGPDGSLLQSVNLDGRGEKFMPGTCVACHGGSRYNGRFPDRGNPSPDLGSGFLPFDTGNYHFSSRPEKTESAQHEAFYRLNELVKQIEEARAAQLGQTSPMTDLFAGWYGGSGFALNKNHVPAAWSAEDAATPGAAKFYREVIGSACRTCHVSLGPNFNWDVNVLRPSYAAPWVCGGREDIARNASMPNALVSRDRVAERIAADADLARLMTTFLGCSQPAADPVYPRR